MLAETQRDVRIKSKPLSVIEVIDCLVWNHLVLTGTPEKREGRKYWLVGQGKQKWLCGRNWLMSRLFHLTFCDSAENREVPRLFSF